jgi:hypothetical protein
MFRDSCLDFERLEGGLAITRPQSQKQKKIYGGHMRKYGRHVGKYGGHMGISLELNFRTYGKIWRTHGKIWWTYGKKWRTYF